MVKAYAVIGANYGDEGKGLVANALCRENILQNRTVLNVLTNGGCQRGHTAYDKNGNRHVYSHFGSGYSYADMYFSKYYMVNPMIFFDEYNHPSKHISEFCALAPIPLCERSEHLLFSLTTGNPAQAFYFP